MPKKKKSIYPLWVLIPALLIYTVFSVVPIVISLVCSFTDWNMGRLYTPVFNGIANYIELLKDPVFFAFYWQYLFVCIGNYYLKNSSRLSSCACYGKENTRKRNYANYLLCSLCN